MFVAGWWSFVTRGRVRAGQARLAHDGQGRLLREGGFWLGITGPFILGVLPLLPQAGT